MGPETLGNGGLKLQATRGHFPILARMQPASSSPGASEAPSRNAENEEEMTDSCIRDWRQRNPQTSHTRSIYQTAISPPA